jgi:hypothetical protein
MTHQGPFLLVEKKSQKKAEFFFFAQHLFCFFLLSLVEETQKKEIKNILYVASCRLPYVLRNCANHLLKTHGMASETTPSSTPSS